jgi:serine/threonine protein kinase
LDHPNIIKLADVFETQDRIFIVMELMDGGELFDYVVEKVTTGVKNALVACHVLNSSTLRSGNAK